MRHQHDPDSCIGRAVAALAQKPVWTQDEILRMTNRMCVTHEQARSLRNQLQRYGYTEHVLVVTDLARKRAAQ